MTEYDPGADDSQSMELSGPPTDGLYSSNLLDWVPLCPQLKDSAIRLYWIMRSLVIEKYGPVRKLTLLQLCYLLPAKPAAPGEPIKPSSLARVRGLLADLTAVGLVTTPEGKPIKTSSRAGAAAGALRLRINDRPLKGYAGPRNAFAALDAIREAAAEAAAEAIKKEAAREAARKAARAAERAGQISGPDGAGQISGPPGQISSPAGQISGHDTRADLQGLDLPFSPPAQSLRSDTAAVRPSVRAGSGHAGESGTDGRTDGGGIDVEEQEGPTAGGGEPAAADAAPGTDKGAATGAAAGAGPDARDVETTPGVEVLRRMGRQVPRLAISGKVLMDQGRRLNGLIASGWGLQELLDILAAPFEGEIRTSAGAVVAGRISLLPTTPYRAARWLPEQSAGDTPPAPNGEHRRDSVTAADWTVQERKQQIKAASAGHGITRDCQADDGGCHRLAEAGHDMCGHHLGWPLCENGCGTALPPEATGPMCETCAGSIAYRERMAEKPPAEPCPGHQGTGCERNGEVQTTTGLCHRCEWAAAEERKRVADAEWAAETAAMVAAVEAAEADEGASAPL